MHFFILFTMVFPAMFRPLNDELDLAVGRVRGLQLLQQKAVDVIQGDVEPVDRPQDVTGLQSRNGLGRRTRLDATLKSNAALEDGGLLGHHRPLFRNDSENDLEEKSLVSRVVGVHDHLKVLELIPELFRVELDEDLVDLGDLAAAAATAVLAVGLLRNFGFR